MVVLVHQDLKDTQEEEVVERVLLAVMVLQE
jgi:hypothetical protein